MNNGYIDAHAHVWPARASANPSSFTPEQLLAQAAPCGVERVVLIQMSFFRFDNSYMLSAIQRYPGVFSGVAVVDHASERSQSEMQHLSELGVRGFRIVPDGQPQTWLDSEGMAAMWSWAAENGLAICPLIDPDALPSIDRMCQRFPQTVVIIDHLARIGVDGRIRDADVSQLCELARHRNIHVKVSAFYALGRKTPPYSDLGPMIRRVVDAYGPQRLMWATDSPFQVQNPHTYSASLALIREHLEFLSSDDREWLLRKTAHRVFFGRV